jgi:hypothetical protein
LFGNEDTVSHLLEFAGLLLGTLVLMAFVFIQRRATIRHFRMWLFCEGLPIGMGIFLVLGLIWLFLTLF